MPVPWERINRFAVLSRRGEEGEMARRGESGEEGRRGEVQVRGRGSY